MTCDEEVAVERISRGVTNFDSHVLAWSLARLVSIQDNLLNAADFLIHHQPQLGGQFKELEWPK